MISSGQSIGWIEDGIDPNPLLEKFKSKNLRMWFENGRRAPHKPLVLLLALGKLRQGKDGLPFRELCRRLPELVRLVQPDRITQPRPEQPFWRLRTDGIWKVDATGHIRETSSRDAFASDLRTLDATGRFTEDVREVLKSDPRNVETLVTWLLHDNFATHLHEQILEQVGLAPLRLVVDYGRRKRIASFRLEVLETYGFRCCVCGYDLRVDGESAGLEAAHIWAHYAHGPDEVPNGLSLCAMHHNTFDRGAFTIRDDGRTIKCSKLLSGTSRMEWLTDFHGRKVTVPPSLQDRPAEHNLDWHRKNIFRRPA